MKYLLIILLAGYAVRCDDDNNYFVIQSSDNNNKKLLKVYWNVPTKQCKSKNVVFDGLFDKYGIIQNSADKFMGENITILYDPGLFPALFKNETSGTYKYRNGGVPQKGNLEKHLDQFKLDLEYTTSEDFDGVGVIDFESWRPIYRQNFGELTPYKDLSYETERSAHWWWSKARIEAEAKRSFEESAQIFMQQTLDMAQKMRPLARWGFYGFPYCFNVANHNMQPECAAKVSQENNRLQWLWRHSSVLFPSVYSPSTLSATQLSSLIRGRVNEAVRCAHGKPVLPYFWFRYRDGGYFKPEALSIALETMYKSNATGFIIWGSSKDVNTLDKCKSLLEYVSNTFGPAVAKYTKSHRLVKKHGHRVRHYKFEPLKGAEPMFGFTNKIMTSKYTVDYPDQVTEYALKSVSKSDDEMEEIKLQHTEIVKNISEHESKIMKNMNLLYVDYIVKTVLDKYFQKVNSSLKINTSNQQSTEKQNIQMTTEPNSIKEADTIVTTTELPYNIPITTTEFKNTPISIYEENPEETIEKPKPKEEILEKNEDSNTRNILTDQDKLDPNSIAKFVNYKKNGSEQLKGKDRIGIIHKNTVNQTTPLLTTTTKPTTPFVEVEIPETEEEVLPVSFVDAATTEKYLDSTQVTYQDEYNEKKTKYIDIDNDMQSDRNNTLLQMYLKKKSIPEVKAVLNRSIGVIDTILKSDSTAREKLKVLRKFKTSLDLEPLSPKKIKKKESGDSFLEDLINNLDVYLENRTAHVNFALYDDDYHISTIHSPYSTLDTVEQPTTTESTPATTKSTTTELTMTETTTTDTTEKKIVDKNTKKDFKKNEPVTPNSDVLKKIKAIASHNARKEIAETSHTIQITDKMKIDKVFTTETSKNQTENNNSTEKIQETTNTTTTTKTTTAKTTTTTEEYEYTTPEKPIFLKTKPAFGINIAQQIERLRMIAEIATTTETDQSTNITSENPGEQFNLETIIQNDTELFDSSTDKVIFDVDLMPTVKSNINVNETTTKGDESLIPFDSPFKTLFLDLQTKFTNTTTTERTTTTTTVTTTETPTITTESSTEQSYAVTPIITYTTGDQLEYSGSHTERFSEGESFYDINRVFYKFDLVVPDSNKKDYHDVSDNNANEDYFNQLDKSNKMGKNKADTVTEPTNSYLSHIVYNGHAPVLQRAGDDEETTLNAPMADVQHIDRLVLNTDMYDTEKEGSAFENEDEEFFPVEEEDSSIVQVPVDS